MKVYPESSSCLLVTGAAGALAQSVIRRLRPFHQLVVCDARREVSMPRDIPSYHVDFNKRHFEDIFRRHRITGIVHLGRLGPNEATRMHRYNANVLGTQRLLDLALKYEVTQVLILSTFFVYGASPYNPALLTESAPLKAAELTMDLVDSVELENLANIYLWKHPELHITLLRPCNIIGPGVNNSISQLLSGRRAPILAGFSPIMQFIHLDDMADAIVLALQNPHAGIYNVAPADWVPYHRALELSGCRPVTLPSLPPILPLLLARWLRWPGFPPYLLHYFKYPVTINGQLFEQTFGFSAHHDLEAILQHYRLLKS